MTCKHCCGADLLFDIKGAKKELKKYNNELRKGFTPPDKGSYPFKVPRGKKDEVDVQLVVIDEVTVVGSRCGPFDEACCWAEICRSLGTV